MELGLNHLAYLSEKAAADTLALSYMSFRFRVLRYYDDIPQNNSHPTKNIHNADMLVSIPKIRTTWSNPALLLARKLDLPVHCVVCKCDFIPVVVPVV